MVATMLRLIALDRPEARICRVWVLASIIDAAGWETVHWAKPFCGRSSIVY